jgi:hypothetical protein
MSRIFRVEDGVVTQARCEAGFGLMKGVPYELLEQVFTDALSDFFKSPPERWDDNSLADPRAVFTWRAPLPGGGMCEATLSVIRKERRRPEISRWPPRYLWTKPEDVAVLLHVTPAR